MIETPINFVKIFEDNQYQFLSKEIGQDILKRGPELVTTAVNNFDTIVFLDRAGRPLSWVFSALWEKMYPSLKIPPIVLINSGQKNLRDQYMKGVGLNINEKGGNQFVGVYDEGKNIELFRQRVREDIKTQHKLLAELGVENFHNLYYKSVLVVDDFEFEGVQRLFIEEILKACYSPKVIEYFEWGSDKTASKIPHGLSEEKYNLSFIAEKSKNEQAVQYAGIAKMEIERFIASSFIS